MKLIQRTSVKILRDPHYRLVGIIGPQGYGKSTLLAQVEQLEPRALVIRLTDADPTPVAIAALIGQAINRKFGRLPDDRLSFDLQRNSLTAIGAAAALRHDLANHAPLRLLVDDAHVLDNEGRRFFLQHLLPNLSDEVHCTFVMHAEENLPLGSQQPRVNVAYLGTNELRFNDAELQLLGVDSEVARRTDAWPAAVMLAREGKNPSAVAEGILATLDDTLVADLRKMSLVSTWTQQDKLLHQALGLHDGWLDSARSAGVPLTQVGESDYQPHPFIREVLLDQLRSRPGEFHQAQWAVASAVEYSQPLTAVEAYLDAGDRTQAQQVLTKAVADLHQAEAISDALPLLERLAPGPTEALHLAWAQAVFEGGNVVRGLSMADHSARQAEGQLRVDALATYGRMRLRTGNFQKAQHALRQAATLTIDPVHGQRVRAELALALALAARNGEEECADEAIIEGTAVRDSASGQYNDNVLMANTAQMIGFAVKGLRDLAHESAERAYSKIGTLPGGQTVITCLLHIANFLADEGDLKLAKTCFQQALEMYGPLTLNDNSSSACSLYLTLTRLDLRSGSKDAIRHADRATRIAQSFQDGPLLREAQLLHLVSILVTPGGYLQHELNQITEKLRGDEKADSAVKLVEQVFIRKRELSVRDLTLLDRTPLDLRAVLLLGSLLRNGNNSQWREELVQVRRKLGAGAIAAYADAMNINLPLHLTMELHLDVKALRGKPVIKLNDQLINAPPRHLVLLLALAWDKEHSIRTRDVPGRVFDSESLKSLSTNIGELTRTLDSVAGRGKVVTKAYGLMSLTGWRITLDIHRIGFCPTNELEAIYTSAVYSNLGDSCPPVVREMREFARQQLIGRLQQLSQTQPKEAANMLGRLAQRDPALKNVTLGGLLGVLEA